MTSWSPWKNFDLVTTPPRPVRNTGPQFFTGAAAVVSRSEDFVNVYARGTDDALLQFQWRRRQGFAWWTRFGDGGLLSSSPAATSRHDGHELVAARGTDQRLWTKEWTRERGWENWSQRGGPTTFLDAPCAVSRHEGAMNIYARGRDDRLLQLSWEGDRGWTGSWAVHDDAGRITSAPAAVSLGPDHEAVFARGLNRRLWWKEWHRDRGWSGWTVLGSPTTIQDGPMAVAPTPDRIEIYARSDTDRLLQLNWTRPGGWDGAWHEHRDGGILRSPPAAAAPVAEATMLFARGTDDRLWCKWSHRDGVLRMPLHFKYTDAPANFSFTTDEVIAATVLVFAGALVVADVRSIEQLNDPTVRDINSGACEAWGVFTTFNTGQRRLFANRNSAGPDDIIVYFVRSASGWAGCAVHPDDRPGCLVTQLASEWVAAHEIGHVLGLGHEDDSMDKLMFRSDSNTALPPDLGAHQLGPGRHIRRS